MPELPDVTVYVEALSERIVGRKLTGLRLRSPFVLRTVEPRPSAAVGRTVVGVRRIGMRIVTSLEGDLHLVVHLMIAGRFQWKPKPGAALGGRISLAAFDYESGTLLLTEASTKQRAALFVVQGEAALADFDRGGIEPLECTAAQFARALTEENHTVKRSLTDPTILSGIGNAYSDEILHRARMSPVTLTSRMTEEQLARLFAATRATLTEWTDRLRTEVGSGWPTKVTAFRPEMAVHGKYGQPCPVCGTSVQRIAYADNETNYCPTCQTDGKLLADRSLSKLFRGDWPKTLAELEDRRRRLVGEPRAPEPSVEPESAAEPARKTPRTQKKKTTPKTQKKKAGR
jgi:formamidopyrimidine-DNA glycosylase